MANYEVELIASKSIMINVKADSPEDAKYQAEEEYYATHSADESLEEFYIKDCTEVGSQDDD